MTSTAESFTTLPAVGEMSYSSALKPRLWVAPLDRSSPPHQIPNVVGGSPKFSPGGEIFFGRHAEAGSQEEGMEVSTGFVYRVRHDGTGLRKAVEQPILEKAARATFPDRSVQ